MLMRKYRVIHVLYDCHLILQNRFVDYGNVYPVQLAPGGTVKLSPEHPLATLDYGTEVAGFPFFEVAGNTSAQIEVKYSESYPPLHDVNADGPWTFSNGLANTWRVETFNITGGGHVQSFFVQGGQRFQSIRLLTNEPLTLKSGLQSNERAYGRG